MGNQICCCYREKKEILYKKINISQKIIKKMTNDELNYKIEILISEKNDNICFAVVYALGTISGIIIICFAPDPAVGVSTFLMSTSLIYYTKISTNLNKKINEYIKELERRKYIN